MFHQKKIEMSKNENSNDTKTRTVNHFPWVVRSELFHIVFGIIIHAFLLSFFFFCWNNLQKNSVATAGWCHIIYTEKGQPLATLLN